MSIRGLALLLLLFALPLQADELRLFELQHRHAEELLPILRPLLSPTAGLSGTGNILMIRSDPQSLQEVEALLQQLDRPPKQLLIAVQQGQRDRRDRAGVTVEGTLEQPHTRVYSTRRQQHDSQDQQLRVTEGNWASIRSGQAIPQVTRTERRDGRSIQHEMTYRDVDSGFEVRPQVSGEWVTLEIRPFTARPAPGGAGVIEQQTVITTVTGRLGEWIELAGVYQEQYDDGRGTVYATRDRQRVIKDVWLKVEVVD